MLCKLTHRSFDCSSSDPRVCTVCNKRKRHKFLRSKGIHQPTVCHSCYHSPANSSSSPPPTQIIPTPSSSVSPIFHPTLTVHSHLSPMKRSAIVTLTRAGKKKQEISQLLQVTLPTIRKWNKQFDTNHDVEDRPRSGRRRTLNEVTVSNIVEHARSHPFSSRPKQLRKKLHTLSSSALPGPDKENHATTDSHCVFIIIIFFFFSIGCVC